MQKNQAKWTNDRPVTDASERRSGGD